jgi:hypothetical protein
MDEESVTPPSTRLSLRPHCSQILDHPGKDRHDDDPEDDKGEVPLDDRDVAKQVPGKHEQNDPEYPTNHIVKKKPRIVHSPNPSDKWGKGTNDRHETGNDDRFAAILFVKLVCPVEVSAIEQA